MRRRLAEALLWLADRLTTLAYRLDPPAAPDSRAVGRLIGEELARSMAGMGELVAGMSEGLRSRREDAP